MISGATGRPFAWSILRGPSARRHNQFMRAAINILWQAIAGRLLLPAVCAIFAAFLTFTLAVGILQYAYRWSSTPAPSLVTPIDVWKMGMVVGSSGTAAALLLTLYFANRNYSRSREHIPHLSMTLRVRRTPVSPSYHTVVATLNARNTGTGLCDIGQVDWTINVLAPYDDDAIEAMILGLDGTASSTADGHFQWDELQRWSSAPGISIEPNQSDQLTCDFIIPAVVTAIAVSVWVANASNPKHTAGWYRRTIHIAKEA